MKKTLMQILRPIGTEQTPIERFSFRVQDGVQIYEHESVSHYAAARPSGGDPRPRLVVAEPSTTPARFISKARSEIKGLTALLRTAKATR